MKEIKRKNIEEDEEYLRQISKEVDFKTDNYQEYIEDLKWYVENNDVYALASVQIGIPKRIIYIKNTNQNMELNKDRDYNEAIVLINPEILETKGHQVFLEGCQSCQMGEKYLVCEVERPYSIKLKYQDITGNEKEEVFEEFKAVVLSHEMDHLDGILHIDRGKEIYQFTADEMKAYRLKNPLKIIDKDKDFRYKEIEKK